jgi:4-amino-4-deoxy-L-arabinose transferase-like glycosyltransferase
MLQVEAKRYMASDIQVEKSNEQNQDQSARSPGVLLGLLAVTSIAAFVYFNGLGNLPLFNPDEALYAEPAREMIVTGECITTLLNYVVRFTKPPLCIWAMAGCYQIFGVNEFAARFFGAACAVVLVAITYLSMTRYISLRAAIFGSLTLASAPLFVFTAREAITDMPLSLFGAGTQLAFFHASQSKFKRRGALYLGYVLIGLAVMTKGPVGLVLPVAILLAWHTIKGNLWSAFKSYQPLIGALIVAVIALPWFVTEIYITKGAYFQEFIIRENFQRFTAVVDSHKQPVYYHLLAMLGGFFPWTVYLPQAMVATLAGYFIALRGANSTVTIAARSSSSEISGPGIALLPANVRGLLTRSRDYIEALDVSGRLALYCILWATITLVFFSASVSKLLPYTLPAFPALAILVGCEFERCLNLQAAFKRLALPLLVVMLVYAAASLVAPIVAARLRDAPEGLIALISAYGSAQAVVVLLSILAFKLRQQLAGLTIMTVGTAFLLVVHTGHILPVLSQKWEGPLPKFANFAGQSADPLIVFDMRKPGVPFYARKQVENITNFDLLTIRLKQVPQAYILVKVRNMPLFKGTAGIKTVDSEGDFALLRYSAGK